MSGSSFTNIFGGTTISPSNPSYLALALTANTQLYWPLETTESVPCVASLIDVTPSGNGLTVLMPPANTGSTGISTIITNVGAYTFTVADSTGTAIATVDTTESWIIALIDNETAEGEWRGYQLASTTSSAVAADLAGAGLQADGSRLRTYMAQVSLNTNTNIDGTYRAKSIVWTGGAGTLQLADIATLSNGWYCGIVNNGTDALVITTTSSQQINNTSSLIMNPGNSGFIVAGPVKFNTLGVLIGPLEIENGGTGADTADQALTNLGGTTIGKTIFTAPNAAAVRAAIGVSAAFTELTVVTSTLLTAGNAGNVIICGAALTLTLPLSTSVNVNFVIQVKAINGNVVIAPNIVDSIDGESAGTAYVMPSGSNLFLTTNAVGNWWILYGPDVIAKSVTVTGDLEVDNTASIGANLSVNGNADILGDLAIANTILIGDNANVNKNLSVTGSVSVGGTISAAGDITGASFSTSGTTTVLGNFNVNNKFTVNAGTGAVTVTGDGNFSGSMTAGTVVASGSIAATGHIITGIDGTATAQAIRYDQFPQTYVSGLQLTLGAPSPGGSNTFLQAGTGSTNLYGIGSVTFAVPFVDSCVAFVATSTTATTFVTVATKGASAVSVISYDTAGTPTTCNFTWIAIGR